MSGSDTALARAPVQGDPPAWIATLAASSPPPAGVRSPGSEDAEDADAAAQVEDGEQSDDEAEEGEESGHVSEGGPDMFLGIDQDDMRDPYADTSEEEESVVQAMPLARPRDNRPRKSGRRATVEMWDLVGTYATSEEKDEKLQQIADVECCGGAWGNGKPGRGWKNRTDKSSKRPQSVRVRTCCFATESKCPACVRELQFLDGDQEWRIERHPAPHADHSISYRKKGVSLKTKLMLSSPSKMALSNADALDVVRRANGAQDKAQVKAIAQVRSRTQGPALGPALR